jgi:DNA-binding NarL/FixJ family response regulator
MSSEPGTGPVRVALVNDYELVVAGIAGVLEPFASRVRVVELDIQVETISDVDVLLYDSFGQVQGEQIDVGRLTRGTDAKVVLFSWNLDEDLVRGALKAGAAGYLSKGLDAEALVRAIERIHAGERVSPLDEPMPAGEDFGSWPGQQAGLTAREAEVLALITQGLSNEEIGQRLYLSNNTIKTYVRTLYRKIDVARRSQAVAWGYEHGFTPDKSRRVAGDPSA